MPILVPGISKKKFLKRKKFIKRGGKFITHTPRVKSYNYNETFKKMDL